MNKVMQPIQTEEARPIPAPSVGVSNKGRSVAAIERRKERNKIIARKARIRKKCEQQNLIEEYSNLVAENKRLKHIVASRLPEVASVLLLSELQTVDEELVEFSRLQQSRLQVASTSQSATGKRRLSGHESTGMIAGAVSHSNSLESGENSVMSLGSRSSSEFHDGVGAAGNVGTVNGGFDFQVAEEPWPLTGRIIELLQAAEDMDRLEMNNTGLLVATPAPVYNQYQQQHQQLQNQPMPPAANVDHRPVHKPKPADLSKSWFNSYNMPSFFMGV